MPTFRKIVTPPGFVLPRDCNASLGSAGPCLRPAVYADETGLWFACQACADRMNLDVTAATKEARKPQERLIPATDIAVNPYPKREIIVVDDFYCNPGFVRRFALQQEFVREPQCHKCQRTKPFLFNGVMQKFEELLGEKIRGWPVPPNGCFQLGVKGDQIVYHSDGQMWAGGVFLNPNPPEQAANCGVQFWRSRHTGLRSAPTQADADRARPAATPEGLEFEMYEGGKVLSRADWILVDAIGNVYNRLVLWRGPLVHSVGGFFGDTKEDGRLNQLFFFNTGE